MGLPLYTPRIQFFDDDGSPLSSGTLETKVAGGGANKATYTTAALSIANTNPIVLDGRGEAAVFAASGEVFWLRLKRADGTTVWTQDNLEVPTISSDASDELILTSSQAGAPFANTFVRFKESGGDTKGFVGYTSTTDNILSVESREDARVQLRTGTPGDPTTSINRAFAHGNATSSWLGIQSPTSTGGTYVKYTEPDGTTTKGHVGYTSIADDNLRIINVEVNADIEFQVNGTGQIQMPLASGTSNDPKLSVTGDPDTGFYSPSGDSIAIATNAIKRFEVNNNATVSKGPIRVESGTAQIKYSFNDDLALGISNGSTGVLNVITTDLVRFVAKPNGQMRFQPLAAAPSGPEEGDVYFNSTTSKLQVYAGGAWVNLH